MSQNKKKNHQYGTFLTARSTFQKYKRNAVLGVLILVFIAGLGAALFQHFTKNKPQTTADTKVVDNSIPGWWYQQYFGKSVCDQTNCQPNQDPDQDGLTNQQEFYYHTNPLVAFTVKDTLNDGQLVAKGFDPSKPGRVTFEEAATPESLLGESIVFGDDIKQIVADANDISKVVIPQVQDDQLQIVYGTDNATYNTYAQNFQSTINKYFRANDVSNVVNILKTGSDADAQSIKNSAAALAADLKTVPVPLKFVQFHKYNILMFQLLSEIILPPADLTGPASDTWYDKTQAFFAVQQKLAFEKQFLNNQFSK